MTNNRDDDLTIQEAWNDFKYEVGKLEIAQKITALCEWTLDGLTRLIEFIQRKIKNA